MASKEEFLKRLLATFKVEAQEHINALASGLIALEKVTTEEKRLEITETIFREIHSLKGAARTVNMAEVENFCQSMESVLAAMKRRDLTASPGLLDVLHKAVNMLAELLLSPDTLRSPEEQIRQAEIVQQLKRVVFNQQENANLEKKSAVREEAALPLRNEKTVHSDTVRISEAKLGIMFFLAEELLGAKLAAAQRIVEARESQTAFSHWQKEWKKIFPEFQKIVKACETQGQEASPEAMISQVKPWIEFLHWNHTWVQSLEKRLSDLGKSLAHDYHFLSSRVDNLLDGTKKSLMVPFASFVEIFPKLVRDLARDQQKEAKVVIEGENIEIDRRILEEMKEPFIHLLRNGVDHGIEKPEERESKKKPRWGTITIAIAQKNNQVEILVSDDGSGIHLNEVKAAALKVGMITAEEAARMEENKVLSLLFHSGLSTSPIITNVSGRGLGLAIVREKVEKLGGQVALETHADRGTTFRIVLPLTLATFRGVIIRVGEQKFVLPIMNVERVMIVNREEIKTVQNKETIVLDGQNVLLVRMEDILGRTCRRQDAELPPKMPAVLLAIAQERIAFLVDEVIAEQEVVVKSLGKQLARVRNVSGAAVLGTGKVVLILNVIDLLRSAMHIAAISSKEADEPEAQESRKKRILVAEDSITARTLLKNILEAAGYDVATAVNGFEAFTQLHSAGFDLVVSDVDMPRMNGFALTEKIRNEKKLAELPVVLVTSLESQEHKERGIEVGANAYLVKSTFDQSNLLEIIERLI